MIQFPGAATGGKDDVLCPNGFSSTTHIQFNGLITNSDILGDLFDLSRGICKGRLSDERITLFKSVGTALEDLAAAELAADKMDNCQIRESEPNGTISE